MKINYIKTFMLSGLVFFASCDNALDINPIDDLGPDQIFTNVAGYEQALSGVMVTYSPQTNVLLNSRMTDEVRIGVDNGGQGLTEYQLNIAANNGNVGGLFNSQAQVMNETTRIIQRGEAALEGDSFNSEEKNQIRDVLAQAYALRALAHLDHLTYFAEDMTDPTSLGVPVINQLTTVLDTPARNTVGEVLEQIDDDVERARNYMDPGATDPYFFSLAALDALMARKALYAGDYEMAASLSADLIAEFPLANREQYVDMYNDLDFTEVILSMSRPNQNNSFIGGLFYFTGTGGAFLEVSEGLFNQLNPIDVRFDVIIDDDETDNPNDIDPVSNPPETIFLGKFQGKAGFFGLNDVKVFRVSEMYLINAEANIRLNQLATAADRIADVRSARFGSTVASETYADDQEAAIDLLEERRIELAFEGHRLVDIKRLGDLTLQGMERFANDCANSAVPCSLPLTDHRFTLPIPLNEINANPNMIQNPGY